MDIDLSNMSDLTFEDEVTQQLTQDVLQKGEQINQCEMCKATEGDAHPALRGDAARPLKFQRKGKDELCHIVHILLHGDKTWKVPKLICFFLVLK